MQDLFISLSNNILRILASSEDGVGYGFVEIPENCAISTRITDIEGFAAALEQLIPEVTEIPKSKLRLNFIIEPQDIVLHFVTVNKNGKENREEQIITEIKSKLDKTNLDELYFSYQKIAPFVYQFVGVRKEILENYVKISNKVGISLQSVLPWSLLLPKYVATNDPAVFISKRGNGQVVTLSELNGVYFNEFYTQDKTTNELQALVEQLSVYKRDDPIKKIFTLDYGVLHFGDGYDMEPVDVPIPEDAQEDAGDYKINFLVKYSTEFSDDLLTSQMNLLSLLPVPTTEKKKLALATVAPIVAGVLVVGLVFGGVLFLRSRNAATGDKQELAKGPDETAVLSESNSSKTSESTASVKPQEEVSILDRNALTLRVENGSNINGIAGKTQTLLEDLGYSVSGIATADDTRDSTLLSFKESAKQYKDLLLGDMAENYPEIVVDETLGEAAEYDVLIVVGTTVKFE